MVTSPVAPPPLVLLLPPRAPGAPSGQARATDGKMWANGKHDSVHFPVHNECLHRSVARGINQSHKHLEKYIFRRNRKTDG